MAPPNDPFAYAGKRVVVTGVRSGIGHSTARLLQVVGAHVHGVDWQPEELQLAAFTQIDLRDPAAIDAGAAGIAGPVDALFNCAGLPPMSPALDVMRTNFIGMRHLTNLLLPKMSAGAAVVTVGSNGGAGWRDRISELREFIATPDYATAVAWCESHDAPQSNAYGFAKEAIVVWTMASAADFIQRGVRINCTSPGSVQTPMLEAIEKAVTAGPIDAVSQPIGRRSTPEEQAWVLLMLNSSKAAYINGVDLPVDGGFIAGRTVCAG